MKKMLMALGLLSICGIGQAAGWTPPLTLTSVSTEGYSDFVIVGTSDGGIYTTGCVANSWIFLADTEPRRNRAVGVLLTAFTSGKRVRLWYTDTCSTWSYHGTTGVMVVD